MKITFKLSTLLIIFISLTLTNKSFANETIIGTSTSNSTTQMPAYGYYDYGWSAFVYSMAEVGGPGTITKLEFQKSNSSNYTFYSQKIYMVVVNDSIFTSAAYISPTSVGATLVYNGNISWNSSTGFQGVTLQTPFSFTSGNLLILYENRDGNYSGGYPHWYYSATPNSSYRAKFKYSDYSFPTGSGSLRAYRPNTKLTYTPAYSNNLTLSQWIYPQTGASASSNMPISIKVKNVGSAAQSNYTVKYSVNNGSTWASQTVTSTLSSGNSVNLTFITPANMSTPGVYQCIAVVKNSGDTIPQDDTLKTNITICGGSYSGTYTVGNDSSDYFPDLVSAFSAFKTCGVSSSVVLKVRAGTYTGQIDIPYIAGLSATKTITIESLSGQKDVILTHTGTSSSYLENYTLKLDSARFIHLKNLKIRINGTISAYALLVDKSSNNMIESCEFEGDNSSTSTSNYFSTIYFKNDYNAFSNQNIFLNNTISFGAYGISNYGYSSSYVSYGNKFIGNTIKDYRYYGIYSSNNDSITIRENEIYSLTTTVNANVYLSYCRYNVEVSANKIQTYQGYGIYLYHSQTSAAYPTKIYNNFIYGHPISSSYIYGIYAYYADYLRFEHNSIYFTNPNSQSSSPYGMYLRYGTGMIIRNNSVVNEASGYTAYIYSTTPSYFDYNNLYTNGSYLAYYNGSRTNLSALQSGTSTNLHSVSTTGVYYNSTNLHSNSSSLNSLGSPSSSITTDIDGETRSTTTPDIGADEFDILSYDAGLLGFTGLTNQCAGSTVPIIVNLKNFGTQTITSAYVSAIIGNSYIHQSWSGFLSPGGNTNISLGGYNFSSDSTYNIVAYVDSVNHVADANGYNDTIWENNYRTSMSGSYLIGNSSSADFQTINDAINGLSQYGVCGPIVFNIESGTYSGNYAFTTNLNGMSAVNTVTFQSLTGDTSDVILTHTAVSSSDNYIFSIQNTGNFIFKHLTLKTSGVNYNAVFSFSYADNISIIGCHTMQPTGNSSSYGTVLTSSYSNHLSIEDNQFDNSSNGIQISGSSSNYSKGISIINNKIHNIAYYGVYAYYADTLTISQNEITAYQNTSNVYGLYLYHIDKSLEVNSNKITIESSGYAYGIYARYVNYYTYSSSASIKYYNNFIYTNSTSGSYSYGLYIYYGYYPKIYFNSINAKSTSGNPVGLYLRYGYYSVLMNNILNSENYVAMYYYGGSITTSDYNNFYSTGNYIIYRSSNFTSISSYQSYYGTDYHSKSVNPGFIADDDLHIFNQVLNNAGSPYGGVTQDIDGETRSTTLPDIGADEFSILSRDIYPFAVVSPANPAAIGTNDVKVTIKNQGTSTLYSASIFYQLDNGSIDSNYWTGSVGFLNVSSDINLGSESLTAGSHTLKVWTKHPNGQADLNTSNDTLTYTFNAIAKPIISVTPSSITDSILICNGSSSQSVTVHNTGSANLSVSLGQSTATADSINILSILTGYYTTSYNNLKAGILANVSNAYITEINTYSATALSAALVGKDMVIVPRISSTSSAVLNAYTAFGPVLQSFASNGGTVIFTASFGSSVNPMFNTGLWSGSYHGYLGSGYSVTINQPNHDLFQNIGSAYLSTSNYYSELTITNIDAVTLASYGSYDIIVERTIGSGRTLIVGFDYYNYSSDETTVITNMVNYGARNNNFISNSTINQTILPNDSAIINFTFNAQGLANGWYQDDLVISHNDQSQGNIVVPCSLYVSGEADIRFNSTFHSFGSVYVGTTITDSVYAYNDGCSNLVINGIASNNSYLVPVNTQATIAPGDSAALYFSFNPLVTGSYSMNATVYNNDSNYVLNFAGSAAPAPILTLNPNPLNVTITNCGDSTIVPVTISNTGGALLTGSVSASSDSINVLLLTYGAYTSYKNNLVNSLGQTFTKYNLTQSYITSNTQLQAEIVDMDVIIIPYINSSSYSSTYNSFATTLQNFVSNGGTVIYAGQYYSAFLTGSGLFSGSYIGYTNYKTLPVATHAITSGLGTSTSIGSQYVYYYNFSSSNLTNLLTYNGYTVSGIRSYGSGNVVYLGFYYNSTSYSNSKMLVSNTLKYVYDNKVKWIDNNNYNFTISSGNYATYNVKFKSAGVAAGVYTTDITFNSNSPSSPTTLLPCTLTVQNQLPNAANLGPDTSYCGPHVLDAGSGYSSYQWNTSSTSQTITASSSGYYMVTVTDGGICSARDTVLLTINPKPNANITGFPSTACTNGGGISLTGSPAGGGFIGNGVNGSTFYPANVSVGPHNITYTVTNSYGCSDTDTKSITVYDPPTVLLSGLSSTYCPQGTISTLIGAPAGGIFSGSGVTNNSFNPYTAGAGNHSVVYAYTDIHGCSNSDTSYTVVSAYTQANITGYLNDYCVNSADDSLFSNIANTSFNGNGMIGNVFSPSMAGVGTHNIYYAYSDNFNCNYNDTLVLNVHALPTGVTLSGINGSYCVDHGNISLSGYPLGGSFSGPGVSGAVFNPTLAGSGNHNVVYSYTDVYGCTNTDSALVTINALPTITFSNLNPAYCIDNGLVNLTASPSGGNFAGAFVTGSTFNPQTAGVGSHYINYSYTDNNSCSNIDSILIMVNGLPTVSFSGLPSSLCSNGMPVTLTGSPIGGAFSGTGMAGNLFNPTLATTGLNNISYSFTDNNGCSNIAQNSVNVVQVHSVNLGADQSITYNSSTQFNPIISGGSGSFAYSWTPANKLTNSTILNPSTVSLTATTLFTLTASDNTTGCVNGDTALVTITGGTLGISISASQSTICSGEVVSITANGSGGSGNYTYSWTSNPSGFTASSKTIIVAPTANTTYSCIISDGTFNVTDNILITVQTSPNAQITNLGSSYCANEGQILLIANPLGGTFTGTGINGSIFNPATASLGANQITYSVVAANGCTDVDTVSVFVKAAPTAYAGEDTILPCQNNGLQIGQQPFSGVSYLWYPNFGLNSDTIANPTSTPNYGITYILTASLANGCQATDTIDIGIIGGPNANVSNDTIVCRGAAVHLQASGGTAYQWSTGDTTASINVTPNSTTTYFVIATQSNCADLDTVTVVVSIPNAHLGKDTSICAGTGILITPGIFPSYLWSTGSSNPYISVDSSGVGLGSKTISVEVTDTMGCVNSDTIVISFHDCTGLFENEKGNLFFSIYPNPSKGRITLSSNKTAIQRINYQILNVSGELLADGKLINKVGAFNDQLDLSTYAKGIYFIRLIGDSTVKTLKITIQ